jgi:endonuclease I
VKRLLTIICLIAVNQLFAGTITSTVSSLPSFGNVYPFSSSTALRYTVTATALTSNLVITADNGFEVSTVFGYGYSKSLTIVPQVGGTVDSTLIFVRFSPSVAGSFSGNIVNSSSGSTSLNIGVTGTCSAWAIPAGYYSTVNTQTGAALKTVLYNKITTHTAVGYTPGVWNSFPTTDVQQSGKVWDIYSTTLDQRPPYEFTLGSTYQDNGTGGTNEAEKYNREHSFPQSWFNSATPMVSDMFHIYATDKKVNNVRSNYPYGRVSSATYTSLIGGKLGTGTNNYTYTGTVFEPIDEYKGDLARGYFYLATCYENVVASWYSNAGAPDVLNGTSYPAFNAWQLSTLLEWNNLDPVSDKEVKRNNAIYALQGNRNPYIDSPQLVQRIWGGAIQAKPTIAASTLSVTNNSGTSITLNWKSGNGSRRIVMLKAGSAVNGFPVDSQFYNANASLTLAPQIGTGNYIVYNGTGSSVTLTNLAQTTTYHFAVIEYNGWYSTSNYQATGILTSNATTLPVELSSFNASLQQNNDVLLGWTTASEQNNDHFTLERSYDAQNWTALTEVKGAGNSTAKKQYQYLDNLSTSQPINVSTIYYRLKQTDSDGTSTYSKTVQVSLEETNLISGAVSPNPFGNQLRIFFQSPLHGEVRYSIQNLMGETYVEQTIHAQGEQTIENRDLHLLPAGIYVLQLQYSGKSYQYKIIKH